MGACAPYWTTVRGQHQRRASAGAGRLEQERGHTAGVHLAHHGPGMAPQPGAAVVRQPPQPAALDRAHLGWVDVVGGGRDHVPTRDAQGRERGVAGCQRMWIALERHSPHLVAAAPVQRHEQRRAVPARRRLFGPHPVVQIGSPAQGHRYIQRAGQAARGAAVPHVELELRMAGRPGDVGADERKRAAVGRPGRQPGQARERHELLGLAPRHSHQVDARLGVEVCVRTDPGGEGDPAAVRVPRRLGDVEVATCDLRRAGTRAGPDHEQVGVVIVLAVVAAPVDRANHPRRAPLRVAGPEPGRPRLGGERDPAAVRRPHRRAHVAVLGRADALGLAAVGADQVQRSRGAGTAAAVPPVARERNRAAVGRPRGGGVAPAAVRQPPGPAACVRHQPQARLVVAGDDRAPCVHDPAAVRREGRRADDDLAADDVRGEGGHTRGEDTGPVSRRRPRGPHGPAAAPPRPAPASRRGRTRTRGSGRPRAAV